MDIVVTQVKQIGREIILDGNSVVGYQHSANLYVKLIKDPSEDSPFSGMALSAYCRRWNSKMPVACPIVEKDDGTYILLNQEVFKEDGDVYLSLGGISDDKVIVTSNNLVLQVDDSNSIITSVTPTEEYWQIEVMNAIKAWYASVVDPTFTASNNKLNQLIRQTEEHELKAEALQSKAEEQQTQVDTAITNAEMATSAAQEAANNANTKAGEANTAAQAAAQATSSANDAAQSADNAAQAASDLVNDISAKLADGELNGKDGKDGKDGELGGDTVPIGSMFPLATSIIPDGWLLCDGSTVSRTDYSELFSVIGESYGAGDGSTTFALPNEPNPLTYTKSDETIQFAEHEPALYMIIKAKQVIPVTGGIINDTDCNSETDALSAAATKNVIEQTTSQSASLLLAKMPNPNLLINGDFQVWQRGTVFEKVNSLYTADRCYTNSSKAKSITIRKVDDGLQFTRETDGVTLLPYAYSMEEADLKRVRGKMVTLSYSVDGEIHTFTVEDLGQIYIANDVLSEKSTFPSTADGLGSRIIAIQYSNMAVGESHVLNWVKLELGEVATPFVPRPYVEELMICKRYFNVVNLHSYLALCGTSGDTFGVPIYNDIPMYRLPDVIMKNQTPVLNYRYNGQVLTQNITSFIAKKNGKGESLSIEFKIGAVVSAAKNTVGYIVNSGNIFLDAEIY